MLARCFGDVAIFEEEFDKFNERLSLSGVHLTTMLMSFSMWAPMLPMERT